MSTIMVELPDEMMSMVERESAQRGYPSVSVFFQDLIRAFQEYQPDAAMIEHMNRPEEASKIEALLLEGYNSPSVTVDEEYWNERKRQRRARFPHIDFDASLDNGREKSTTESLPSRT